MDDYLAKLNLDGNRGVWEENVNKIDFVLLKSTPYIKKMENICEIGIGNGYLLKSLSNMGFKCTGVDISEYLIKYHKKNFKNIKLILSDISDLNINEKFDAVYCLDIIEHIMIKKLDNAINNINKMLYTNGYLIGTIPYNENLDLNMVKCPSCGNIFHKVGHKQSFNFEKLCQILTKHNFEIILFEKLNLLYYNKIPLYRIIHKLKTNISFWLNIRKMHNNKTIRRGDTVLFIARKINY